MKKAILMLALLTISAVSYALEAKGVIEEVRACAFDNKSGNKWARVIQFKIDEKWFGIYSEYYGSSSNHFDYRNNVMPSMVFMAYSQQKVVEVKATDGWSGNWKKCGASDTGGVIHDNPGDYIRLSTTF